MGDLWQVGHRGAIFLPHPGDGERWRRDPPFLPVYTMADAIRTCGFGVRVYDAAADFRVRRVTV